MTTKKQAEKWINQIDKRLAGIAAERNRLDEMIAAADDLKEICVTAYESLQAARDALSELV